MTVLKLGPVYMAGVTWLDKQLVGLELPLVSPLRLTTPTHTWNKNHVKHDEAKSVQCTLKVKAAVEYAEKTLKEAASACKAFWC